MRKGIKIWFHFGVNSSIREFTISAGTLRALIIAAVIAFAGSSYIGYDYLHLKQDSFNNRTMANTIAAQKNEIKNQRIQIQSFAGEIESLKKQVENLSKFENKVRVIADIQRPNTSSSLIGIGGIPEETLDINIPLEEKHNNLIREMHRQINQVATATKRQVLDFKNLIKMLEQKRNLLASTPSIRPADGWVTSGFGYRISPFTGQKEFHAGLDIANKPGTKIIATADGRVSFAGGKMYIGNMVIIDHGHGRITKYGHMKKILVHPGQRVKRGEVIGLIGNTGRSTGPHVHYEVRINGTPVNPLKYILN
jgi:murein DD-endopeptidase MepM/ murein hydrolase activator NlpD